MRLYLASIAMACVSSLTTIEFYVAGESTDVRISTPGARAPQRPWSMATMVLAIVGYEAMALAVEIARENGVGAVGAIRSSHFGAAGAYVRAAAEAGMIGFATTNADSEVTLFDEAEAFHGTNPFAFAAPSGSQRRPWLVDMATSSIPFNRVFLYRSLGLGIPDNVAADATARAPATPIRFGCCCRWATPISASRVPPSPG